MSSEFRILIAAGNSADAGLLREILGDEFNSVHVSSNPKKALDDFESIRPQVIVLAFGSLAAAERYYLGLFRSSEIIHTLQHRAIVLCFNSELRRAFDLCKQGHFDDYVPYWPTTNDPHRLSMAIRLAKRSLHSEYADQPSLAQIKLLVQRITALESLLDSQLHSADGYLNDVDRTIAASVSGIDRIIAGFSRHLSEDGLTGAIEIRDMSQLQNALRQLESSVTKERLAPESATQAARRWVHELRSTLTPHMDAVRELETLGLEIRPVVLLVEDDEFQRKLVDELLQQLGITPIHAGSAIEAFAKIGQNPALILTDISMPEIDGIELTRRLKSIDVIKEIPVIMITGKGDKVTVEQSLAAGAADFLVKPVQKAVLKRKLQKFITLPSVPAAKSQAAPRAAGDAP